MEQLLCLCCKKNPVAITCHGNVTFRLCGKSDCSDDQGRNVGQWLASDDNFFFVEGLGTFEMEISGKRYKIAVDKRIIKGLGSKIREIMVKSLGIETHNTDKEGD